MFVHPIHWTLKHRTQQGPNKYSFSKWETGEGEGDGRRGGADEGEEGEMVNLFSLRGLSAGTQILSAEILIRHTQHGGFLDPYPIFASGMEAYVISPSVASAPLGSQEREGVFFLRAFLFLLLVSAPGQPDRAAPRFCWPWLVGEEGGGRGRPACWGVLRRPTRGRAGAGRWLGGMSSKLGMKILPGTRLLMF